METRTEQSEWSRGLEDVVVAETRLSRVDGEDGTLVIGGRTVDDLSESFGFGELFGHLLELATEDSITDDEVSAEERLGRARIRAYERLTTPSGGPRRELFERDDAMEALRAGLALFETSDDRRRDAVRAVGAVPVANALWHHARRDTDPIPPNPERGHAADYLRMLQRASISDVRAEALETYMMAVSDHGLNASTFTARVIASTESDLISALVGAVGALKGPLHGGAPGPVAEMLDEIGAANRAEEWIEKKLDAGERIMGMGHRVYEVRDPRAAVFEAAIENLDAGEQTGERLDLARTVEETAERILAERHPDGDLRANVEFYTAVLLETVGIPRELFSSSFAAGRAAGWAAHVLEQGRRGRLIRPSSLYDGPTPK